MPRHWVTITLVLAFVAGLIALLESPSVVVPGNDFAETEAHLAGYLVGVTSTRYTEEGRVEYQFTAERLTHYQLNRERASADDFTTIEAPFFTIYHNDNAPWHIRAREGESRDNDQLFILQGDVEAWQEDPERGLTHVATEKMDFRPPQQTAETDQFVMITHPGSRTQGRGMFADLKQETLQILSEGSTVYEPNP